MKRRKLIFLLPCFFLLTGCKEAINKNLNAEAFTSKLIPNWPSLVAQVGALVVLMPRK